MDKLCSYTRYTMQNLHYAGTDLEKRAETLGLRIEATETEDGQEQFDLVDMESKETVDTAYTLRELDDCIYYASPSGKREMAIDASKSWMYEQD